MGGETCLVHLRISTRILRIKKEKKKRKKEEAKNKRKSGVGGGKERWTWSTYGSIPGSVCPDRKRGKYTSPCQPQRLYQSEANKPSNSTHCHFTLEMMQLLIICSSQSWKPISSTSDNLIRSVLLGWLMCVWGGGWRFCVCEGGGEEAGLWVSERQRCVYAPRHLYIFSFS